MSEIDETSAIRDSFIQDGVSWEMDANMKLRHLWRKLQRTEDALRSSHSENTTLKKEKKEEMDTIQRYLDNFRDLSGQKEQLVEELQAANKQLKSETAQTRLDNEALLAQLQAVTELISHEQQMTGKTVEEQVQFLLEERSNYSKESEKLQGQLLAARSSQTSLQEQLAKSVTLLEKERSKHKVMVEKNQEAEDSTKLLQELKKSHEKEKSEVLQKYFKISSQMAESKQKIIKLQEEMKQMKEGSVGMTEQHRKELQNAKDVAQVATAKLKQMHQSEIKKLRTDGENASAKLTAELSSVTNERDVAKQKLSEISSQLRDTQEQVDLLKNDQTRLQGAQLAAAEVEITKLKRNESSMASRSESLQALLTEAQTKESKLKDAVAQLDQLIVNYKQRLCDANNRVSDLTDQLQEMTEMKDSETRQLKAALANSDGMIESLQQELQCNTSQSTALMDKLKAEITSSNCLVTQLQAELKSQQESKLQSEEELKANLDSIREEIDNVRQQLKETKEANITLVTQLEQKQEELQAVTDSLANREETYQHQELLLSGETQKVTLELENAQSQLIEKQETYDLLQSELAKLRDQNSQLINEVSSLNCSVAGMKDQLSTAEQELELLKHEASQLQEDSRRKTSNSSRLQAIQSQHEATINRLQSELKAAGVECSQLKQEHRETTAKLSADIVELEETNRALSEERGTVTAKLQSATDVYKGEKTRTHAEIKHLQKMLQEAQAHSQQQAEELKVTKEMSAQSTSSMSEGLAEELHQHKDKISTLEEQNHQFDLESSKLQAQLMELEERAAVAGASKLTAEQELAKQLRLCRRAESKLAKTLNEKASINKELQKAHETVIQYKQKVEDLTEKMLGEAQQREWVVKEKESIQEQMKQNDLLRSQLEETREQLQQEKLNIALMEQSQNGFTDQIGALKQMVAKLEALLAEKQAEKFELKSCTKIQKQNFKKLLEQMKQLEADNQAERDRVAVMQQEVNTLRLDIVSMEGHLEGEQKRMNQKSRRSLDKLHTSKEKHTKERLSLESSISGLQEELRSAKLRLSKEATWRENNQSLLKKLLEEKSQLLLKFSAVESENQEKMQLLMNAESHIRQLQHENELVEAKHKSLLVQQQQQESHSESLLNLLGSFRSSTHAVSVKSELQSPT